jgi:hypothetical protein
MHFTKPTYFVKFCWGVVFWAPASGRPPSYRSVNFFTFTGSALPLVRREGTCTGFFFFHSAQLIGPSGVSIIWSSIESVTSSSAGPGVLRPAAAPVFGGDLVGLGAILLADERTRRGLGPESILQLVARDKRIALGIIARGPHRDAEDALLVLGDEIGTDWNAGHGMLLN